jgi:hypothetical protein
VITQYHTRRNYCKRARGLISVKHLGYLLFVLFAWIFNDVWATSSALSWFQFRFVEHLDIITSWQTFIKKTIVYYR